MSIKNKYLAEFDHLIFFKDPLIWRSGIHILAYRCLLTSLISLIFLQLVPFAFYRLVISNSSFGLLFYIIFFIYIILILGSTAYYSPIAGRNLTIPAVIDPKQIFISLLYTFASEPLIRQRLYKVENIYDSTVFELKKLILSILSIIITLIVPFTFIAQISTKINRSYEKIYQPDDQIKIRTANDYLLYITNQEYAIRKILSLSKSNFQNDSSIEIKLGSLSAESLVGDTLQSLSQANLQLLITDLKNSIGTIKKYSRIDFNLDSVLTSKAKQEYFLKNYQKYHKSLMSIINNPDIINILQDASKEDSSKIHTIITRIRNTTYLDNNFAPAETKFLDVCNTMLSKNQKILTMIQRIIKVNNFSLQKSIIFICLTAFLLCFSVSLLKDSPQLIKRAGLLILYILLIIGIVILEILPGILGFIPSVALIYGIHKLLSYLMSNFDFVLAIITTHWQNLVSQINELLEMNIEISIIFPAIIIAFLAIFVFYFIMKAFSIILIQFTLSSIKNVKVFIENLTILINSNEFKNSPDIIGATLIIAKIIIIVFLILVSIFVNKLVSNEMSTIGIVLALPSYATALLSFSYLNKKILPINSDPQIKKYFLKSWFIRIFDTYENSPQKP